MCSGSTHVPAPASHLSPPICPNTTTIVPMPIEPLERSLREMGLRLTELQQQLPEVWDEGDDDETDDLVASINAIEEEWLVDPDLRRQFSVIEGLPNNDD